MKIIKRILKCLVMIIIIILFIVNTALLYSKYIAKDIVVNLFGYTYMIVQSNSMEPIFTAGDKLIVLLTTNYKVGDIITYKKDGIFITHRIVSINDNSVITKGDSNNVNDVAITKDLIVGVVKKIIK